MMHEVKTKPILGRDGRPVSFIRKPLAPVNPRRPYVPDWRLDSFIIDPLTGLDERSPLVAQPPRPMPTPQPQPARPPARLGSAPVGGRRFVVVWTPGAASICPVRARDILRRARWDVSARRETALFARVWLRGAPSVDDLYATDDALMVLADIHRLVVYLDHGMELTAPLRRVVRQQLEAGGLVEVRHLDPPSDSDRRFALNTPISTTRHWTITDLTAPTAEIDFTPDDTT